MKKIMFNDKYGLTEAVLEGRKTMTRRIVNFDRVPTLIPGRIAECCLKYAPYKVGEVVAVAQKYEDIYNGLSDREARWFLDTLHLRYDDKCARDLPAWRNKEFVLADLMPHQIRITNVRVERLQDISDEDCIKEGIQAHTGGFYIYWNPLTGSRLWLCGKTPRAAFADLIDKVSGKGTWESNPWGYVYEFELVK